jgi:DNA-binding CsgD family transcriptional regulator
MNSQCQPLFQKDFQYSAENYVQPNELAFSTDSEEQSLGVMLTQVDYIRRLSSANTPESFNKQILSMLSALGFTDYALVCKSALNSIESPHNSLPEELFNEYEEGKYCRFDMVLDYIHAGEADPILLSMIGHIIETAPMMTYSFGKNLQILALYRKFNIDDAYVIPVQSQRGSGYDRAVFSVMAAGTDSDQFLTLVDRYSPLLRVLADAVSLISETKFLAAKQDELIKAKPLRLLSTMAQHDVSLAQAAENLCISLDTANKHMALAKQAMGTSSQANAVYLAVRKGLISM